MPLSYSLRLLCLIVCGVGSILVAAEIILYAFAPLILRSLACSSARRQELVLYAVQILPIMLSAALTAFGLVPDYLIHETNIASERVGWFCLALAFATTLWFARSFTSGWNLLAETVRFTRACRRGGQDVPAASTGTPIVAMQEMPPGLALVGLLRPLILISSSLLAQGGLDPLALEVALDHERAHARTLDNWKLFSLHALPSMHLRLPGGKTWSRHWSNAAECAADNDAVRGESTRALLLAETLVALSRNASTANLPVVSTTLMCAETDLVTRVDRLLQPVHEERSRDVREMLLLCSSLLGGALAFTLLLRALADLPEHLLHLG